MPAMEEWREEGMEEGDAQDELVDVVGGVGGGVGGGATVAPMASVSKRQRRPSVRLGEIGDQKNSKPDVLGKARWFSPSILPHSTLVKATTGKLPRTRPLANVSSGHRGENELQGVDSVTESVEEGKATKEQDDEEEEDVSVKEIMEVSAVPPSEIRGNYGNSVYGNRKGKPGKRKRASNIRSTNIARTIGVVNLNRKAKELQKVGVGSTLPKSPSYLVASEEVTESAGMALQIGGDEPRGVLRSTVHQGEYVRDHKENGGVEILRDSGREDGCASGEDNSSKTETRGSLGANTTCFVGTAADSMVPKEDRDHGGNHLTDGVKERSNGLQAQEGTNNVRQNGVRRWLQALGLGKYAELFEENEVDKDVLPLLTFDDLREMGISAVGARRKMFSAIQEMAAAPLL